MVGQVAVAPAGVVGAARAIVVGFFLLWATTLAVAELDDAGLRLSDEELAALDEIVALTVEDNPGPEALIAAARTLAIQQDRTLPAYRDLYQSIFDALFVQLLKQAEAVERHRDRVAPIVAAYERFYRDDRWFEEFRLDEVDNELEGAPGQDWTLAAFNHPILAQVAYPDVIVRKAVWDADTQTLQFVLEPRKAEGMTTTFRIANIPTNFVARLEQEGRQIAAIDEHGQASGPRVVNRGPGEIEITVDIAGLTEFTIRPE